ncbi:sensor histidine kinase [Polyangium jinanense]|uniref:histidine kinase n=1 Tax=Polyangium jinanense TaxID=2829994 RepID=A0A9X3X197_9BACT|nr:ATP-binding protein [Polyangium jinanense]MDC3955627.1 two-component sensor histidine kinase [Polyangium jinanense]MDC3982269.1 two-component sensor histidine kinase [Polyangium jinanense]
MKLGIRDGAESSFAVRFAWLTGLRLIVLTIVLIVMTTIYLGGIGTRADSSRIAMLTFAVAFALTGVYAAVLRIGKGLPLLAYGQMLVDQVAWSMIVYVSGGATSGATSLYGFTCLCGAILLGLRGALIGLIAGASSYALICMLLVQGYLKPPPDQPLEAYATDWSEAAFPLVLNLLAMCVVALLGSYLAERLRETGGRLVVATARAEQAERLAALGRLAAGLAHEIRNPLGSIVASIELLRTGGSLGAEDEALCAIIERETTRLNELVTDMLDVSRPRAPSKAPMDLAATARDVVVLAGKSGRGRDVPLRFVGPNSLPIVGDMAQVRQVVWNLLRNAIQASSAGAEVVVRVEADAGGAVVLAVEDRGVGIPPEARERLFDAFFTTRSQGMGIGLAVVKRILDDHGFAIEVESEPGKGTTFRVRIPASKELELASG